IRRISAESLPNIKMTCLATHFSAAGTHFWPIFLLNPIGNWIPRRNISHDGQTKPIEYPLNIRRISAEYQDDMFGDPYSRWYSFPANFFMEPYWELDSSSKYIT